jgi:hypothetical protein
MESGGGDMTREELEADIRNERYQEWRKDQPECEFCHKLWTEDGIYDEDRDQYFCDDECKESYEQNKAEAAYLRLFEGEGPVTAGERHEQMARWQRELKR